MKYSVQNTNPPTNEEVKDLLESLIGVETSSEQNISTTPDISQQETYQLPVRIGINRESLDEGGTPWMVGGFSPGIATDKNHPKGHNGIDLKGDRGTPVYPIASGIISETGNGQISGNYIKIAHERGHVVSYYGHLDSINCQKGQQVSKHSVIGHMGDTGNAKGRGPHLHYEVKIDGVLINPYGIVGKQVGSLSKQAALFIKIIKTADQFYSLLSS